MPFDIFIKFIKFDKKWAQLINANNLFGASLHLISDTSPIANQFIIGLGGVGTIIRYPLIIT